MLSREKRDKFQALARELYTKEYLGTDGYGKDIEYEEELTEASAMYLMTLFYDYGNINKAKEKLYETMDKKVPNHSSNLLYIIRDII